MPIYVDGKEVGYTIVKKDLKLPQVVDKSIVTITADDLAGATKVGDYAFYYCTELTSIEFPSTVTSIEDNSFQGCTGLTGTLTIPASVTSLGSSAFNSCNGFTALVFEDGIQLSSISSVAFYNCTGLTGTLTIPSGVINIDTSAFNTCINLTSIIIPSSVTSIGNSAFSGCRSLTGTLTIPSSVTSIERQAFLYCGNLLSVVYEGQAPDILYWQYMNCSNIMKYDFRNCTSIPSLNAVNDLGHADGCQIIVPDALYDEWTQSTNWVALTDVTFVKASEV